MGNVLIKEETMTAIAESIREKKGSTDLYKPAEMPGEILTIKTGGGTESKGYPDKFKPIRFYGAYGELLYSYTLEEFEEVTELPALPEYDGLISQEWNWTLENIKAVNGEVEIGSLHITDDGSTRIYVRLVEGALSPKLGFIQNRANAVWVDWGDGSELESSETYGDDVVVSMEHIYAEAGEYVIRLIPEEDAVYTFSHNNYVGLLLHEDAENGSLNRGYLGTITKIELGKNITSLGKNSFRSSTIEYVVMTADVTDFSSAFSYAHGIRYLVFPKGITSLTSYGLADCFALGKIVFSETKCTISESAFRNCSALTEFVMSSESTISGSYIFYKCISLKRVVLPKAMIRISTYAFQDDAALVEVVVRNELKEVQGRVFTGCENLKYFELPDTVYSLGSNLFYNCNALQAFRIPKGVSYIDANTFYGCSSLKEIALTEKISKIGSGAFGNCISLKNYYLYGMTPPTLANTNALTVVEGCKIHVPKGCLEAYQIAANWSTYADYMIEMEE